jgi:hypothetical protein
MDRFHAVSRANAILDAYLAHQVMPDAGGPMPNRGKGVADFITSMHEALIAYYLALDDGAGRDDDR